MSVTANLVIQNDETFYQDLNDDDNNIYREGPAKTNFEFLDEEINESLVETNCGRLNETIKYKTRSPRVIDHIIDLQKPREDIKQIWNGIVTKVDDQEFTVRLEDKTNPENPDELVVLSIDEIEDKDHPLIKIGAMLLWHIGYISGRMTPRYRFSKISFRRLPKWTEDEVQEADQLAKEYADFFLTDTDNNT